MIDEKRLIGMIQRHAENVACGNKHTDHIYKLAHEHIIDLVGIVPKLEENGLLLQLPCKIGATVYVLTACKNIPTVLDGGYYDATGYYCPYELYDNCPHTDCDGCDEAADKLAVFEDTVNYIGYDETGLMLHCEHTNICGSVGEYIFLTREEAEKTLAERG